MDARTLKKQLDDQFRNLIRTSQRTRRLGAEYEAATAARDDAIHHAWADGVSARAIAHATQLSHARIQQIVGDREDRAASALQLQPALRERRQDRERSRMLLAHFEAQQDNVFNGIRERVERGLSDDELGRYVAAGRDFALSWRELGDALGTNERDARARFGWLDEQPTRQRRVD